MHASCYENQNECPNICPRTREALMQEIMEYEFALLDLGLFLDTHPCCERTLEIRNEYSRMARKLSDEYQRMYGPLTCDFPCNSWRWLEQPWPWERREC